MGGSGDGQPEILTAVRPLTLIQNTSFSAGPPLNMNWVRSVGPPGLLCGSGCDPEAVLTQPGALSAANDHVGLQQTGCGPVQLSLSQ